MRTARTFLMTAGFLALMLVMTALGSGPNAPEEYAIRKLVAGGSVPRTENAIIWPTTSQQPSSGKEVPGSERAVDQTIRVVVSDSADLASEYGTFKMSSRSSNGTTRTTEGAYLRVWQKVAGQWKLATEFRRPYGQ